MVGARQVDEREAAEVPALAGAADRLVVDVSPVQVDQVRAVGEAEDLRRRRVVARAQALTERVVLDLECTE